MPHGLVAYDFETDNPFMSLESVDECMRLAKEAMDQSVYRVLHVVLPVVMLCCIVVQATLSRLFSSSKLPHKSNQ